MSRARAGAAAWLGLAAAPTFAVMGLVTILRDGGPGVALCSATPGGPPLDGMVVMYLLMSAFHLGPWLKLASDRPRAPH